jgi:hypothetical protein
MYFFVIAKANENRYDWQTQPPRAAGKKIFDK